MLKLRTELKIVAERMKANHLTWNFKKTKYVVFGTRHSLSEYVSYKLEMQSTRVEHVRTNILMIGIGRVLMPFTIKSF